MAPEESGESALQLCRLERADAAVLFDLTCANRGYRGEWLVWVDAIRQPADTQAFVDDALKQVAAGKQKHFLLWLGTEAIGTVCLTDIDTHQGTVGYWIAQWHQGAGHMTQAVRRLMHAAFYAWGMQTLHLEYLAGNAASARVAEKCGFRVDRIVPNGASLYGRTLDRICCVAQRPG